MAARARPGIPAIIKTEVLWFMQGRRQIDRTIERHDTTPMNPRKKKMLGTFERVFDERQ
jgi:hypothetical protein